MENQLTVQRLENAMRSQIDRISTETKGKYNPNYYRQMLNDLGALATAQRLFSSEKNSEGFTRLLLLDRIDLTLEYLVVNDSEFLRLFPEELGKIAKRRVGVR